MKRRAFLQSMAAFSLLGGNAVASTSKRHFIVILLRGGMDGLDVLAPVGDPNYRLLRPKRDKENRIPLNSFFSLHSALSPLRPLWKSGEMSLFHAVGLQGMSRSHFSAQDLLEQGDTRASGGWLGRSVETLFPNIEPVALGQSVPIILRGASKAFSMAPNRRKYASEELLALTKRLYMGDMQLQQALAQSLQTQQKAEMVSNRGDAFTGLRSLCAFARAGTSISVLEIGGWDTHANQKNKLKQRLKHFASVIDVLKSEMGTHWRNTAILAVSEFGRCVRFNGTGGTDHGTGGAAFLIGGAVKGGRVISDWPGLKKKQLFEGRDLAITTDVRSIFKGILHEAFGAQRADFNRFIFPSEAKHVPLRGLLV